MKTDEVNIKDWDNPLGTKNTPQIIIEENEPIRLDEKRILNGGQINNLAPFKYPWAWDMHNDSLANHWTPQPIPMGTDKHCFEMELNEVEREMFVNVFAMLTTSDMVVGRNIAIEIYKHITAPEICSYLNRQIAEEGVHCYIEGTEILTTRGFIDFRDLQKSDKVAQYLEDGTIEFVKPKSYTKEKFKGKLIHFNNLSCSHIVTPNHRCVYTNTRNENKQELFVKYARDFNQHCIYHFPVAGIYENGEIEKLSWFDRLNIAYQADGLTKFYEMKDGTIRYKFRLKKERKIDRLRKILDKLELNYYEKEFPSGPGVVNFFIYIPKETPLSKDFSWVQYDKISQKWMRQFLFELTKWDGTYREKKIKNMHSIRYSSHNYDCLKTVQTIGTLCGMSAGNSITREGDYHIYLAPVNKICTQTISKDEYKYNGYVYSVGVPSSYIITRYNGKVIVSGNSDTYQHCIEILGLDQQDVYTRYLRYPAIKAKFDMAAMYAELIHNPKDLDDLLIGLIHYYAFVEGVWFYNGFSPILSLQRRNLMKGTGEQLTYILRDESMHVAFGIRLIKELIKEESIDLNEDRVVAMFRQAMEVEEFYAREIIPNILGYSSELHIEQAKFLTNRRLNQLGIKPIYEAKNVLTWLDEQVTSVKEKNFFEGRVKEYQSAATLHDTWD